MTKIEKLQESIKKAEAKVEKCKGTILRHQKALLKKVAKLEKAGADLTGITDYSNLDSLKRANGEPTAWSWEAWEVESKVSDIKSAEKKLKEAEAILEGWKEKLAKEKSKNDFVSDAPQVLIDFLENWKEMAYDWHVKRFNETLAYKKELYAKAKAVRVDCFEQGLHNGQTSKVLADNKLDSASIRKLLARKAGSAVVLNMLNFSEGEHLNWLNNVLEADKRHKLLDLLTRVKGVVGEITDASHISVNSKGNLDGFITGTEGKAIVETIGAGGYNIVCFHYRTLIKPVK